jgi:D-beta-D-heptose 7-phosphate kinase/D-beta-D-heptose 1-phosphate adenosyltransferase
MMMSLKYVNDVKTFSSRKEMIELIKEWKPYYMVLGSDYVGKEVVGSELITELVFFNRISGYSTTNIIGR